MIDVILPILRIPKFIKLCSRQLYLHSSEAAFIQTHPCNVPRGQTDTPLYNHIHCDCKTHIRQKSLFVIYIYCDKTREGIDDFDTVLTEKATFVMIM